MSDAVAWPALPVAERERRGDPCAMTESATTSPTGADPRVRFATRVASIPGSIIDRSVGLLQAQTHDVIRFAMGSPAEEAIPVEALREIGDRVAADGGATTFDYGPTEGEAALRRVLPRMLADHAGLAVEPAELLVTTGGMQGLDLTAKLFVERGDLVVVEAPTYTNGAAAITSYQGEVLEVPVDADGLDVERMEELVDAAGRRPSLIYVIPTFQNPGGTTLSLARRKRLIELAAAWGSVILEDDPYGFLHFGERPLPTLRELAVGRATVVHVGTFSKILAPGLRVGWVVADPAIVAHMTDARQGMDTCTNVPLQRVAAEFVECGLLDAHLARLRGEYRERKEAMQAALEARFGGTGASWSDPAGGFFLWMRLPATVDTTALFPVALEHGVAYIPGSAFTVAEGRFRSDLRLCFASSAPSRIAEGVERLHRAIVALAGEGYASEGDR